MKEITLGGKPKELKVLTVHIGEESYKLPLAGTLTPKELAAMDTPAKTLAFLEKYIPKKVAEALSIDDYNALVNAWKDASQEASGVSVGE